MAINRVAGGAVILAGAGMCTGGRVRHHLKHNLGRRQCSVIFVGFAAQGTLARQIVDGAKTVKIFGEDYPVLAQIHTIGGFSAHAGQSELLAWHRQTGHPETTFLVHGEKESMHVLARLLTDTRVKMPELQQSFAL
jgi:metallo-beta-lactamase family protein